MSDYFDEDPWATPAAGEEPIEYRQADQPADEAQTATPTSKETAVTHTPTTEGKLVTTIKYGAGYGAPWDVLHTENLAEADAILASAEFKAHAELVVKVAKGVQALWGPEGNSGNRPAGGGGQTRQQQSPPPGVETKTCPHGEMTYRTGTGAKGPWAGHFCPLERGNPDQCKAIFIRNR
ncbi:hypothetical protein ACIBG8_19490 [Nonomuraea sp. NPDC050556]|uniref:hypothetical protein n=1 Tax=Nonomuraea sp. NPDC050556 TaxID=3364369 RepID=UPI0037A3271B